MPEHGSIPEQSFLARKFSDLPGSHEVARAVKQSVSKGEGGPKTREARIDRYIQRLNRIAFTETGKGGERRGLEMLKTRFLDANVTQFDEISENYWKLQEKIVRERGQAGDYAQFSDEQLQEARHKHADAILADQRASLEQWVDYFGNTDSSAIPPELKYWILRSVVGLQEYDKEKKVFPKRSKGTVAPFPDINYEGLAYIVDALEKHLRGEGIEFEYDIQASERTDFNQAMAKENFAALYAWANELMHPIPEHLLPVTEGVWKKYDQGSDATELTSTIRGKGTGWCTAGERTAKTQLSTGDFYVYYSDDDDGNSTIPRIAIRWEDGDIAEVRGIAKKQNMDAFMAPILKLKLKEFGEKGEKFLKRTNDSEQMSVLEEKTKAGTALTASELRFLYEVDEPIEEFGYVRDPRIAELRSQRNTDTDMLVVFDCEPHQIARSDDQINESTKAYVGKIDSGVFDKIAQHNIEHIYLSFPERKIRRFDQDSGGRTLEDMKSRMRLGGHQFLGEGEFMVDSDDFKRSIYTDKTFTTLKPRETHHLIRLSVADLGFPNGASYPEIMDRALKLGLELCLPEDALEYRISYTDQPIGEYVGIGIKPISGRDRNPRVFNVRRSDDGSWLINDWASPDFHWDADDVFVFRLRKKPLKP
ncbi:MAG: hypothetical protein AAB570_00205 [Patescibacteria group bacterium]